MRTPIYVVKMPMKTLNLVTFNEQFDIAHHPKDTLLDLSSPALSVVRDFELAPPLLIEGSTPIKDAAQIMQRSHVNFKLVVDQNNQLAGTLSYAQVSLQSQMAKLAEGYDIPTMKVNDVMNPIEQLQALEYIDLKKATVGHVLNTLSQYGLQYCLVVNSKEKNIRGLICADEVARKINIPINLKRKTNFVDLFKELHVH